MKMLMASLFALTFLTAPLVASAAEDAPSSPAPTEEQNTSNPAPSGVGSGGKRCGSGHSPSV